MEEILASFGTIEQAIYAILAYSLSAYLIGYLLLKPLSKNNGPIRVILSLIIGYDVLAILGLIFSVLGILKTPLVHLIFIIVSFLSLYILLKDLTAANCLKTIFVRFYESPVCAIILILTIFLLGRALCLPCNWDELVYQLSVPIRWLNDGFPYVYKDNPYSAFPSAANFSYLLLIKLGGIRAPRIFILILWVLNTLALYLLMRRHSTKTTSCVFTLSFALACATLMAATSAYTELFILSQLSAFLLLTGENDNSNFSVSYFVLAGFFCGIAASVKLTGLIIGVGFFAYIFFMKLKNTKRIQTSALLLFLMISTLTIIVFYVRPYFFTGNPLYPYFAGIFTCDKSTIEMSNYHHLIGGIKYGIHGIASFFSIPFLLAISPSAFDGGFGLQFLIILLLCFYTVICIYRVPNNNIIAYLVMAFLYYVFWFFTAQQSRFLLPAVFILFLVSSYSVPRLSLISSRLAIILLISLTAFSLPINIIKDCIISWKTVFGAIKTSDYVYSATGVGYLKAIYFTNTKLPKNAKIMLLFENRGLYLKKDYVLGTPFLQEKFFTPPESISDSSQIIETLKKNNISHVMIGLSEKDPDRIASYLDRTANFAKMIGSLLEDKQLIKLWEEEGFCIYEVKKD